MISVYNFYGIALLMYSDLSIFDFIFQLIIIDL